MTGMLPSRRQALAVTAGLGLFGAGALGAGALSRRRGLQRVVWTGQIMGATASLTLHHDDPERAREIIGLCLNEVDRLEQIFSLIRPDSEVSRLNRKGWTGSASPEMIELIGMSQRLSALSLGAFDISVQALWTLYSGHFARLGRDARGPEQAAIDAALASVGWRDIVRSGDQIRLNRSGMGLTFNSIARGYATDRVGDIMRREGLEHVLVDLDNYLALGPRPDGEAWRLGVADPQAPDHTIETLEIKDRAVASAGGYGTIFDRTGLYHHIFDPHSGRCANCWAGATVIAKSAAIADALSTALLVAPKDQAARLLAEAGGESALLIDAQGVVTRIS